MEIKINNKAVNTESRNILELSRELALPDKGVAVAVSNKMVPREEWESTSLTEGSEILIIKAVCGG